MSISPGIIKLAASEVVQAQDLLLQIARNTKESGTRDLATIALAWLKQAIIKLDKQAKEAEGGV